MVQNHRVPGDQVLPIDQDMLRLHEEEVLKWDQDHTNRGFSMESSRHYE